MPVPKVIAFAIARELCLQNKQVAAVLCYYRRNNGCHGYIRLPWCLDYVSRLFDLFPAFHYRCADVHYKVFTIKVDISLR